MSITFTRIDPAAEREALVAFLTGNRFPHHVAAQPTRADVESWVDDGRFRDEDNDSFWIDHAEHDRVGFFRFEDLSEDAPLFDLRLDAAWRGRGLAAPILQAATERVFTTMPEVTRFEGQTREDNAAMRRTFRRCGWVQEAYYREAWPVRDGSPLASVAYSVLRRDWETGTTTPVVWDAQG
ncbi:GNAT family protein [Microbacterium sp. zg-Y818]|uniref:GNAT family N-acetyltransferase n=1 Tax=unclassified Microbacterium TaxID=2609290 RepID=UPI00214AEE4F|nr:MULTISPECIES: GNAT family protein [unclassified Microbacterium]MCR2799758.1 GNAT family N-acetyltransferase [Microbacterium sp. zg.Y818]WIM21743.1 GNAT family protein [Microbacterium sp. zg-Y818]